MNAREKFHATMNLEAGAPIPKTEYGYWVDTIKRFIDEGMPVTEPLPESISSSGTITGYEKVDPLSKGLADKNVKTCFGLDAYLSKFPMDLSPLMPEKVIGEDEQTKIYTDSYGITKKVHKNTISAPLEIARPIKNRADFEDYKTHYSTKDFLMRLPNNWESLCDTLRDRDFPIRLGGNPYGFFGMPRHLFGDAELMMMMYDDPQLIKDINEFYLNFVMEFWSYMFKSFIPDCCLLWEDMCFKGAAMISGDFFEEFLTPYYIRIIDFLKQYGVNIILVDSDGYVEELIPHWLKAGVTGLSPFEIQAGNDMLRIRQRYPRLRMLGGIDKKVLAKEKTKADIDAELERVKILLQNGSGYVPHIDHFVSPDACWENFKYYRTKLNEMIDSVSG